jgi:hypothetical protein
VTLRGSDTRDPYPFVLTAPVVEKLALTEEAVSDGPSANPGAS